jgi:hypothetical protein
MSWLSASPTPSQLGKIRRFWVQENIQGMARRLATLAPALRREGRLPMLRLPSSLSGVAAEK